VTFDDDLRDRLQARAASLRTAADPVDLAARIEAAEAGLRRRQRLVVGVALVVLAGSLGSLGGAYIVHADARVDRVGVTYASAALGKLAGPVGRQHPRASGGEPPHSRPGAFSSTGPHRTGPTHLVERETGAGVSLVATEEPLPTPVELTGSGAGAPLCASGVVVTAEVGVAGVLGGGEAVVGFPGLGHAGLEVVTSGALSTPIGRAIWSVVAVGTGVREVTLRLPRGGSDEMTPRSGIALLAAIAPAPRAAPQASAVTARVVATGPHGAPLATIRVAVGSGPAVTAPSPRETAERAAARPGSRSRDRDGVDAGDSSRAFGGATPRLGAVRSCRPAPGPLSGQSGSVLSAGEIAEEASVVSAFEGAYAPDPAFGEIGRLAEVEGGTGLLGTVELPEASRVPRSPLGAGITVYSVDLLGGSRARGRPVARTAEVGYKLGSGPPELGRAVLQAGRWVVARATYCADLASTGEHCPPVAARS
jgi:hypothetical protein